MQAVQPPFPPDDLRKFESRTSPTATPMPVEDHELEEEAPAEPAPVVEVSEAEFDELAEPVPSGAVDLTARVAAALAASTRAEANLKALFRTVKFLGASVGAARETNAHLLGELTQLHSALSEDSACDTDSENTATTILTRATLLEQALREATEQAVREREFLIAEHDTFIASLIADHEQELAGLRQRVNELEEELQYDEDEDEDDDEAGAEDDVADSERNAEDQDDELSSGWLDDD